jgi:two-component system, OmpR family, response regulator AdeR
MAASTVLIIDSDDDSLAIYSLILNHHGYRVLQARDAESGLEVALALKPDVVVSDYYLPKMDGMTLLTRLQADERLSTTALMLLDSMPSRGRGDQIGRVRRLPNPCSPSRLVSEVSAILKQSLPTIH